MLLLDLRPWMEREIIEFYWLGGIEHGDVKDKGVQKTNQALSREVACHQVTY